MLLSLSIVGVALPAKAVQVAVLAEPPEPEAEPPDTRTADR